MHSHKENRYLWWLIFARKVLLIERQRGGNKSQWVITQIAPRFLIAQGGGQGLSFKAYRCMCN